MIFTFLKRRRRDRLRARSFPAVWKSILNRNLPIFRRLPSSDQSELLGDVQVLLAEKHFEGWVGPEFTVRIPASMAAKAGLFLFIGARSYSPQVIPILFLPSA